jgi:hypothetical protein
MRSGNLDNMDMNASNRVVNYSLPTVRVNFIPPGISNYTTAKASDTVTHTFQSENRQTKYFFVNHYHPYSGLVSNYFINYLRCSTFEALESPLPLETDHSSYARIGRKNKIGCHKQKLSKTYPLKRILRKFTLKCHTEIDYFRQMGHRSPEIPGKSIVEEIFHLCKVNAFDMGRDWIVSSDISLV